MHAVLLKGADAQPTGARCDDCTLNNCAYVPGYGPETARLVIVGEAPGSSELTKGKPFVGRAGELLDHVLQEAGISRDTCFITNAVLCRPWPHRAPRAKEIAACRERLIAEVHSRTPEVVLALGNAALRALAGRVSITSERGSVAWSDELSAYVVPTYHPAAVLRQPGLYIDLVKDVRRAAQLLARPPATPPVSDDVQYVLVEDRNDVDELVERLSRLSEVAVDVEVSSTGDLLSIGLSWKPGTAVVVARKALVDPYTASALNRAFGRITLVGHNLKYDIQRLWEYGITFAHTGFDTMLSHYVLDERRGTHSLKKLAREYFQAGDYDAEIKLYIKRGLENCPPDLLYRYNALDASYTVALAGVLRQDLGPDERRVLEELLHPASDVLARMERLGVLVDREELGRLDAALQAEIEGLRNRLFEVAGREFNPNSWQQIARLLYQELELPIPGRISTDKDALKQLEPYHPLPGLLLKYRGRKKFHGTYVAGLRDLLGLDGRVHTSFNLHGTATGRLSSSDPNLQNIPKPENDGGVARNLFIASSGYTLLEADLSQAEVRTLAWFSKDRSLIEALAAGGDMHVRTACLMFKKKPEEVTPQLRQAAKRLVFATIYGMSALTLAEELGVTLAEAEDLQRQFFGAFPKVQEWIEAVKREVLVQGYVRTPFGRKRRFEYITSENKEEVLRQAVNSPIQSVASDITLRALIRLGRMLEGNNDTRLLLTVHDSLLLETREDVNEVARMVKATMEDVPLDGVPFVADIKVGTRWGSLKKWEGVV